MEKIINDLASNILKVVVELKKELQTQDLYSPIIDKIELLISKRIKQLV